jgi:hypothetical protein
MSDYPEGCQSIRALSILLCFSTDRAIRFFSIIVSNLTNTIIAYDEKRSKRKMRFLCLHGMDTKSAAWIASSRDRPSWLLSLILCLFPPLRCLNWGNPFFMLINWRIGVHPNTVFRQGIQILTRCLHANMMITTYPTTTTWSRHDFEETEKTYGCATGGAD